VLLIDKPETEPLQETANIEKIHVRKRTQRKKETRHGIIPGADRLKGNDTFLKGEKKPMRTSYVWRKRAQDTFQHRETGQKRTRGLGPDVGVRNRGGFGRREVKTTGRMEDDIIYLGVEGNSQRKH